jgi:hypothetical protein
MPPGARASFSDLNQSSEKSEAAGPMGSDESTIITSNVAPHVFMYFAASSNNFTD